MTPCPATSPSPPRERPQPPRYPRPPHARRIVLAVAVLAAGALAATTARGQEAATPPDGVDTALAYCTNLADEASDARFARKAQTLKVLEEEVEARLNALEEKRTEYQNWLERREEFLQRAQESLVSIYSGMRPDAASAQLAVMDEFTAAAIVAQLTPRNASSVLNEMETEKAARLATIMATLGRGKDGRGA
ncbi:MotE family protein [Acuticoccus sp. MNP-M23]|uniref:MotE family protein n=1 Tax=Acuticoccus sp. MNP-M23 TaxID=3072793 RepID=UPI002815D695|nr:MotE family protein [Acuticoccus sp. MNP-M23]WMS41792.1 MotE family protein [Acuticoccus sp. MNP-M23]